MQGRRRNLQELQSSREETLSELSRQIQEWTAEKELAQDELNRLEIELQVIWEKRSGLFTHKRQIEQRIQTINTYLLEKERDSEEALQKMHGLEKELEENEQRIAALEQTRTEAEEALAGINERVHAQTSSLERKEEIAKGLKRELETTRHEQDALQVRLVEVGLKKKNLEDQVWQRHRIDMTAEPELELSEEADEEIEQQLEKLYASLERIGEVNPTAIEEFESLQQRHQFYQTQFEDLKNSLESLKRLIQRINRITKTRFLEAFEQINERFQKIFPQLFKGGKAFLQLDNPDDPLESGVDMVAQPPGKRLQNINLLSGGEKSLAALAMVIAIFQYKPSPFCVLDEVDAALDDVNVMRFTEILREISGLSQFILITHNKQTMEIAEPALRRHDGIPWHFANRIRQDELVFKPTFRPIERLWIKSSHPSSRYGRVFFVSSALEETVSEVWLWASLGCCLFLLIYLPIWFLVRKRRTKRSVPRDPSIFGGSGG